MGSILDPSPAKLAASVLYREVDVLREGLYRLEETFGPLDTLSPPMTFAHTRYYEAEMGGPARRVIVSFRRLLPTQALCDAKLATCRIEQAIAGARGGRPLNLDPGCVTEHALFLATTKPSGHRPHLGSGIYADLTLLHRRGGFEPLPWTYPDYSEDTLRGIFDLLRARLLLDWTGRLPKGTFLRRQWKGETSRSG